MRVQKRCENPIDAMIPLLNRGGLMKGFVQGADRQQTTLLPECLDDVGASNPIRAVDVFVDALELRDLGFDGVDPAATGRPAYHPSPMLKLYIYGYLNRVQSSRRLEREAGRNLEVMWLTGRLTPDHKTIFRKDMVPRSRRFARDSSSCAANVSGGSNATGGLPPAAWPRHAVVPRLIRRSVRWSV
jgi:hypothetical protein